MPSKSYVKTLSDHFYPTEESRDPGVGFSHMLEQRARPDWRMLDVGAGAGLNNPYKLKGKVAELVGADFDDRVEVNPLLDKGVIMTGGVLPFDNESFDAVFSIYVWEHIENPEQFLAEIFRVVKPGGVVLSLTPNKFHYVPLIANVTPHSFHEFFNKLRGRDGSDTFPTHYRLNDVRAIVKYAKKAGFDTPTFKMIECRPNYLAFSLPTFLLGILYERLVNSFESLSGLRVNILAELKKPSKILP